ncbi:cytochrome P450 [Bisporella sp. PMI_857]|nr:cytochrome P450 [Bisporella sp. PMI_857]
MIVPSLSIASAFVVVLATVVIALSYRILYNIYFHPLAKFPGLWYATSFLVSAAVISQYGTEMPIRISPAILMFPKPSALKEIYWDLKCNKKSGLYGSGVLGLKNPWETRIDDQISLFVQKMNERAVTRETVCLSDKVAWRLGLDFFGFVGRFTFFRNYIMKMPVLNMWLLPKTLNDSGMGWLMAQADRHVTEREKEMENGIYPEKPNFMHHAIEARMGSHPLSPVQKRAHHPEKLALAHKELKSANPVGHLSIPVNYEEVRIHLPYFVACIKESLRKKIEGMSVPPNTEITSLAYVVQRDPELYAPDPEVFRPERWPMSKDLENELDTTSFVFGVGPRVCSGKDIATMELYKLLPEFDFRLLNEGRYVVAGGVAYNKDFRMKFTSL